MTKLENKLIIISFDIMGVISALSFGLAIKQHDLFHICSSVVMLVCYFFMLYMSKKYSK